MVAPESAIALMVPRVMLMHCVVDEQYPAGSNDESDVVEEGASSQACCVWEEQLLVMTVLLSSLSRGYCLLLLVGVGV